MLTFLADECVPRPWTDALRARGYDIEEALVVARGVPDLGVLDLSVRLRRILITYDTDFGELTVSRERRSVGVILVRLPPFDMTMPRRVEAVVDEHAEVLSRSLVVIKKNGDRVRALLNVA